jgi:hypothetical protein
MGTKRALAAFQLAIGVAALGGVITNLVLVVRSPADIVNFFSFFTIWSNGFAGVLFVYAALHGPSPRMDALRGAAVVWLATTGTVDLILLGRGVHLDLVNGTVHFVLHRLVPVAVAVEWAVNPPVRRLGLRMAAAWLSVPIFYAAYTMVRGSVIHWYPYGFFDPSAVGGYPGVLGWVAGISAGVLAVAALVILVGRLGRRTMLRAAAG